MILVGRSHKMIVRDISFPRKFLLGISHSDFMLIQTTHLEDIGALVAKQLGINTRFACSPLDFQAMFIGTRAKYSLFSLHDMPALDDVRQDHSI